MLLKFRKLLSFFINKGPVSQYSPNFKLVQQWCITKLTGNFKINVCHMSTADINSSTFVTFVFDLKSIICRVSYSAELYICIYKYPSTNIGHNWSIHIQISIPDYAKIWDIRAGKTKTQKKTKISFFRKGHLYKFVGFIFI